MATARRFTLRVRAATQDVVLTMPVRGSLNEAKSFASRHAAWIGAKLRQLPEKIPLQPGGLRSVARNDACDYPLPREAPGSLA